MPTKKTATKKLMKQKNTQAPASRGSGGPPPTPPRAVADVLAGVVADGFFAPLANTHPWVNAGIFGGAGTGKTRLAAKVAIGLWRRIRSTRPIVVVDTEQSSRFLVAMLAAAGIPAVVRPSRSLVDWAEATRRAAGGVADIVITDSLSHIWEDYVAAFVAARDIRGDLSPSDWVALKTIWHREWAHVFTSAAVHQIFTSRSADQYVDVVEPGGKVESIRSGTKIRGEAETAYEPSLLVEVTRTLVDDEPRFTGRVLKDRTDTIDGALLASPDYLDLAPAIEATLAGAAPAVVVEESSAAGLFVAGADARQAKRLVEEVRGELQRRGLSTQQRAQVLTGIWGHASWARLSASDAAVVEQGLARLRVMPLAPMQGPSPEAVVASIRQGLAFDPGDPVERQRQLAAARHLAGQLPPPHRGEALGVVERTAHAWEAAEFDQRPSLSPSQNLPGFIDDITY
jgi:hypothetical protein